MFDLIDAPMRLQYYVVDEDALIVGGAVQNKDWYFDWLDSLVREYKNVIFFMTVETTDIFEKEWDFNEVATMPSEE